MENLANRPSSLIHQTQNYGFFSLFLRVSNPKTIFITKIMARLWFLPGTTAYIRLVSQDWSFEVKLDLALPSCDVSTSALSCDLVGSIFLMCSIIGPCKDELRTSNRFIVNKPWKFNRPYYWNTSCNLYGNFSHVKFTASTAACI